MVDTQVRPDVSSIRTSLTQIKPTRGMKAFNVINVTLLSALLVVTVMPFINLIAIAFSSDNAVRMGHVTFWPVGANLTTFHAVLTDSWFWQGYWNTLRYTVVGTTFAMILTTTFAYALSRKYLKGKNFFIGIAVFTMFFGGGIIPNFILIRELGMRNTMWAIVIPGALSVFNMLVMKSFFENFPTELEEAGQIDGLSQYGVFFRIVLPLSKAILATMTLFYGVGAWNSWFGAFIYLDHRDMFPVMMYLRNLIVSSQDPQLVASGDVSNIGRNIGAVAMLLTTLPIMCVYPFIQKYFVSGVMLGSVKG
ncbi:MAG: carbohydrate ABC transporter permease [Promicromonosporaceae bacterium]|nr:carbohydrate ABC transporter permease [Promicromonosporaceae bacterium]